MIRTVKTPTLSLSSGKANTIQNLARAYFREKSYWLEHIPLDQLSQARYYIDRVILPTGYKSSYGLQARMWKLALQDAANMLDVYYKAYFVRLRRLIHRNKNLNKEQKHYANWILSRYDVLSKVLEFRSPKPEFEILYRERLYAARYLRRIFVRYKPKDIEPRLVRSFTLDQGCYSTFKCKGHDYIGIMTLIPYRRLVLPLKGHSNISGNIRIVVDKTNVAVHTSKTVKPQPTPTGPEISLDYGYTEVFTDSDGDTYGDGFGALASKYTDEITAKGKKRGRLHALAKNTQDSAKARRIRKNNLRKAKQERRKLKKQVTLTRCINESLNDLISAKHPSVVITEDLSFTYSKDKGKVWNLRHSQWTKGVIQERTDFKVTASCARHENVNAAYTSITCPPCGYIDRKNRNGDSFKCLKCGHTGHADHIAAINVKARWQDTEIHLYTPYKQVYAILMRRYERRLKSLGLTEASVSGRTLETVGASKSIGVPATCVAELSGQSESEYQEA